jgi:hypothetical protein
MRGLPEARRAALLAAAGRALAASPFRFEAGWARVLRGEEEAAFAWAALNGGAAAGGAPSRGVLDLGGSSLEVAFEPAAGAGAGADADAAGGAAAASARVAVALPGAAAPRELYVASHPGYGLDDAFARGVEALLAAEARRGLRRGRAGGGDPPLAHPCLHEGFRRRFARAAAAGAEPPEPPDVDLAGAPDAEACRRLAAGVAAGGACGAPRCALGARAPPRAAGPFVALAGFHVVRHFFGLPPGGGLAGVAAAARAFCAQPWAAAAAAHAGELAVEAYCFRAPYVEALVAAGLGLPLAEVAVGGEGAGWTAGAALVEGHRLAGLGAAEESGGGGGGGASALAPALLAAAAALVLLAARRWGGGARAARALLGGGGGGGDLPQSAAAAAAPSGGVGEVRSLIARVLGGGSPWRAAKKGSPAANSANWGASDPFGRSASARAAPFARRPSSTHLGAGERAASAAIL